MEFDIKRFFTRPVDPVTGQARQPGEERPQFKLIHRVNPQGENLQSIEVAQGDARYSIPADRLVVARIFPDQGTLSVIYTQIGSQRLRARVFSLDQIDYHLMYK